MNFCIIMQNNLYQFHLVDKKYLSFETFLLKHKSIKFTLPQAPINSWFELKDVENNLANTMKAFPTFSQCILIPGSLTLCAFLKFEYKTTSPITTDDQQNYDRYRKRELSKGFYICIVFQPAYKDTHNSSTNYHNLFAERYIASVLPTT